MKKSLKVLALGLAAVPCALMLTGCGDNDLHIVDTKGTYATSSSYAEVETYVEETPAATTELDSYRMVIRLDISTKINGRSLISANTESDTYVTFDGDVINMVSHMKGKASAMGFSENINESTYIINNTLWQKSAYTGEWESAFLYDASAYLGQALSFDNMFADLDANDQDLIDVDVDNSTEGTYKVRMTMAGSVLSGFVGGVDGSTLGEMSGLVTWDDAEIYFIFEDNKFVGSTMSVGVECSTETAQGTTEMTMDMEMEFAPYTGTLEFPDELV